MAEFNQFGSTRPVQAADAKQCAQFEAMLADAVDGTLTAEDQAAFDLHLVGCATCSEQLAGAKRGAAWLEVLRQQTPVPPAAMLERILAQTSGLSASGGAMEISASGMALMGAEAGLPLPGASSGKVVPFRKRPDWRAMAHTVLQPRLAMTAAMAFFSVALTLNLTGVRLSELRASDLKPSSLKRSLSEANAHMVRYYTNLRVVYELESRVRDLQRSSDSEAPVPLPQESKPVEGSGGQNKSEPNGVKPGQESAPKRRQSPGTSRREPIPGGPAVLGVLAQAGPGPATERQRGSFAALEMSADERRQERGTV